MESLPIRLGWPDGSGSTSWLHTLHHTMSWTQAAAALPSVIGGPGCDFISQRDPKNRAQFPRRPTISRDPLDVAGFPRYGPAR
jgi:hypothetical protein